ncbi:MAG: peptidylprolyl isomerase [Actinobacteria bacterium]|nr:peptidylprolyl isomerase [Actinomycetota bacterium]NIW30080.1 peptidylprolyl isomerase [Actinomycetota bacterium]
MPVADQKVVTLTYTLSDPNGKELERSAEDSPLTYLHGAKNIVPGLEKELTGKEVGDDFQAVVAPEDGYGPKRGLKPVRLPRSKFAKDAELKPGIAFMTQGPQGQSMPLWIKKVQGPTVVCSVEHPFAGLELHFRGKIVDIRDATEEEVEHGHAHGPGSAHDH